ncbi:peptidoglycan recognition protein family protein [Pseudonocardia hydrocarbonoxydans]|uniref:Peptidoglycan recognition protein family domain-containing protein n=1 Tax=Pseudonocardia hydrocarbonoxydans TaxID=76726 RepID=A0A4Y3WQ26_9PSEU|nr:peptidoglycan recognition family protein [Pseudonocardia hydrocarbonoxydans]GEC20987.1 hypothetical protein PHY01_32700 [Pseudonocardia hydrocarbonoxydans]
MITIYGRNTWGARYAAGFAAAPLPASEVWLHHSVTSAPPIAASFEQDTAAVRVLERIGQDRFGGGISYTFAVCPSGRVFEGHAVDRRGAHTAGRNSFARAICLVGDYERNRPTEAQIVAVAELLRHGATAGWWRRAFLNGGHRDAPGARTACPGRYGWDTVPAINRLATLPITPEDDMFTDADRALLASRASREDLGFARDQLAAGIGVDPAAAPPALSGPDITDRAVARRVDVGYALEQILARLDAIEARLSVGELR